MLTADTPFTAEDDGFHQLTDSPYETETNWWSFNIPERNLGCWIHTLFHPAREVINSRIFAWDNSGVSPGQMAYFRRVDAPMPRGMDLRDITFPVIGYQLKMLEPLMKYHLTYHDKDRGFALDFVHTGAHAPWRFPPGVPPFRDSPHLDQLGHIEGEMTLRGEKIRIDSWSVRDRSWGPRGGPHSTSPKVYAPGETRLLHPGGPRWREIERERGRGRIQYIFGHHRDRTGFLSFCRTQDGRADGWCPMNAGWMLRDGRFTRLDAEKSRMRNHRDPRTGHSAHMEVELTDTEGRTLAAEGFAVSRMRESGYGVNSLMRWEMDGHIGWGEDQDVWGQDHFTRMLDALRAVR